MVTSVHRRRTMNASQINASLRAATGVILSTQTVRRRLHEQGLRARRRAASPQLLPRHRAARRVWAQEHANWDANEWNRCMFTDECRFNLYEKDGRILVYRAINERYLEENREERVAFGGGGVTVWGGIMNNGRTDLVVLIGESMNAERYRDMCLRDVVLPFKENFGNDFLFVDDNARPHRANIVNNFLRERNIERKELPARSADMNPIEHVWSRMKLNLNRRENAIVTLNQLSQMVRNGWENVPRLFLNNLIASMPRRVAALSRNRGGPTKY